MSIEQITLSSLFVPPVKSSERDGEPLNTERDALKGGLIKLIGAL